MQDRSVSSTQRVIAHEGIYGDFLDVLSNQPLKVSQQETHWTAPTKMGPMIREDDAIRVSEWVDEAVSDGAELLTGGERNGQIYAPTLVANVKPEMKISHDEIFGPVVGVTKVSNIDDAIALANDTNYGLKCGDLHREYRLGDAIRA